MTKPQLVTLTVQDQAEIYYMYVMARDTICSQNTYTLIHMIALHIRLRRLASEGESYMSNL